MTKTILDIVERLPEPAPWSEGDNIPWDDPAFSERMLAEHLSQEHDLASRKSATIERHVGWIFSELLGSRPARVLDLACGPGLYTIRLARAGCECVGLDFSPASIRHAVDAAADEAQPACTYRQADLRDGEFGEGFDLAMMIYGQLNVFPRSQGREILENAHRALKPGGALLLEVQSRELIRREARSGPSWFAAPSGLFSDSPHVVLQESFWHADAGSSTRRFWVIDAHTGAVSRHALSNEAYTPSELTDLLLAAGFTDVEQLPSLSGEGEAADRDFSVVVATS